MVGFGVCVCVCVCVCVWGAKKYGLKGGTCENIVWGGGGG